MKITLKDKIDNRLINFKSDLGEGIAVWEGEQFLLNTSHDIELEVDDVFEWDKNIFLSESSIYKTDIIGNELFFNAKVISCEEDGVLVLSLGKDIIFIELLVAKEIDGYVSFFTTPDKVSLYHQESWFTSQK